MSINLDRLDDFFTLLILFKLKQTVNLYIGMCGECPNL